MEFGLGHSHSVVGESEYMRISLVRDINAWHQFRLLFAPQYTGIMSILDHLTHGHIGLGIDIAAEHLQEPRQIDFNFVLCSHCASQSDSMVDYDNTSDGLPEILYVSPVKCLLR